VNDQGPRRTGLRERARRRRVGIRGEGAAYRADKRMGLGRFFCVLFFVGNQGAGVGFVVGEQAGSGCYVGKPCRVSKNAGRLARSVLFLGFKPRKGGVAWGGGWGVSKGRRAGEEEADGSERVDRHEKKKRRRQEEARAASITCTSGRPAAPSPLVPGRPAPRRPAGRRKAPQTQTPWTPAGRRRPAARPRSSARTRRTPNPGG
jgi:hypothetical protein